MPQPTQHSLIHVLLLWTTILSIFQGVFIILFFTTGHTGQSQNSSAVASLRTVQPQANSTSSSSSAFLHEAHMFIYTAYEDNGVVKWMAKNPNEVVSDDGKELMLKRDGYFFLNLQVTLTKCNNSTKSEVKMIYDKKVLLRGWINPDTCSTGLLGKVDVLSGGSNLEFYLPSSEIDKLEHHTHLDIIYISKPKGRL